MADGERSLRRVGNSAWARVRFAGRRRPDVWPIVRAFLYRRADLFSRGVPGGSRHSRTRIDGRPLASEVCRRTVCVPKTRPGMLRPNFTAFHGPRARGVWGGAPVGPEARSFEMFVVVRLLVGG